MEKEAVMRQILMLAPALVAAALNAQMPEVVIRATTRTGAS